MKDSGQRTTFFVSSYLDFLSARSQEFRTPAAFYDRVSALADIAREAKPCARSGSIGSSLTKVSAKLASMSAILRQCVGACARLSNYFAQLRFIRNSEKAGLNRHLLAISIASNRLPLGSSQSVRRTLFEYAQPWGSADDLAPSERIKRAPTLMIFDALPVSSYWRAFDACSQEHVVIIDLAFLLFVLLANVRRSLPDLRANYLHARLQGARVQEAWVCAITEAGYCEMFRGFTNVEAIFFTRWSKLTELLRLWLIERTNCSYIREIMHGLGTEREEEYFATILSKGAQFGSYERHKFIPQVPGLKLIGIFDLQKDRSIEAINAYWNRMSLQIIKAHGDLQTYVEAESSKLAGDASPLIITLFGQFAGDDAATSPLLRAECFLLSLLSKRARQMGIESKLIYVPHPQNGAATFPIEVFAGLDVTVYRQTVVCWLVSDAVISMYSCAMFEGAYFGAEAMTPLILEDRIYAQLLDEVYHPRTNGLEDLDRTTSEILSRLAGKPRQSAADRIQSRLRRTHSPSTELERAY